MWDTFMVRRRTAVGATAAKKTLNEKHSSNRRQSSSVLDAVQKEIANLPPTFFEKPKATLRGLVLHRRRRTGPEAGEI